MSFANKIIAGLLAGTALGLFLGEWASFLGPLGDAFIGMLQMTVLPYIVVTLVIIVGRLDVELGRRLISATALIMFGLLGVGVLVVLASPLALPQWESGSFFSSALVEPGAPFDLVELYVPSNPFFSLANAIVPAIVVFSILLGVGVIGVEGKERLLGPLEVLDRALNRVNKLVIRFTPAGVFAIAADTAGTLTLTEVTRLQAYLLTYTAVVVVLLFVTLPALIAAVTPFRYRDVFSVSKETLITIFATGKIIVVLPQLVESVQELYRRSELLDDERQSTNEIVMPLAYPFPNLGSLAIMLFVPFAAWYAGLILDARAWSAFLAVLLPSSFVAPIASIPFMLDLLRIPADMFELFVVSTVYTDRIRVALGGMYLFTLTVLVTARLTGLLRIDGRRFARVLGVSVVCLAGGLLATRALVAKSLAGSTRGSDELVGMTALDRGPVVRESRDTLPPVLPVLAGPRLDQVRTRGYLRAAYARDALPFAFVNRDGQVVGYDIDILNRLALDLDVDLELARISMDDIPRVLEEGRVDLVVGGIPITPISAQGLRFSRSYMDETLAFLVADARRNDFSSADDLEAAAGLTIGVVTTQSHLTPMLGVMLPDAEVVAMESPRPFLRGEMPEVDAVLFGAERGSAWTLIYPQFTVAVPLPDVRKVPLAMALPEDDPEWDEFVSTWLEGATSVGLTQGLYEHWILGAGARDDGPRWSILRDLLEGGR